jgi:hypothetical protein
MSFAIFFLPIVLSAAHYIAADIRRPQDHPDFESSCR